MLPVVNDIAQKYKAARKNLYGSEFAEGFLFGSHARGDFHPESDNDFAVLLTSSSIRPTAEIFKASPICAGLNLKYDVSIATHPVSSKRKQKRMMLSSLNANRIVLCKQFYC